MHKFHGSLQDDSKKIILLLYKRIMTYPPRLDTVRPESCSSGGGSLLLHPDQARTCDKINHRQTGQVQKVTK